MLEFDKLTFTVHLDSDNDYFIRVNEYPSVTAFADTPNNAFKEIKTAYEIYTEVCKELGKNS